MYFLTVQYHESYDILLLGHSIRLLLCHLPLKQRTKPIAKPMPQPIGIDHQMAFAPSIPDML